MVIMNIEEFYSLNIIIKFLFISGLQVTSPKFYHPLTVDIWNYPKLFRNGINVELLLLKRRSNVVERKLKEMFFT